MASFPSGCVQTVLSSKATGLLRHTTLVQGPLSPSLLGLLRVVTLVPGPARHPELLQSLASRGLLHPGWASSAREGIPRVGVAPPIWRFKHTVGTRPYLVHHALLPTVCVCAVLVLWHMGSTGLGGNPPPQLSASFKICYLQAHQCLRGTDPSPGPRCDVSHPGKVHRLPCAAPWVQDSVREHSYPLPTTYASIGQVAGVAER